jgi:sporadic carbohydrate cluster protein (TIGR04323 family)
MTAGPGANRRGLRGYVTSRAFGKFFIPVPLQSLALRDYCARKGKLYVLPVNENDFAHSYMVLEGLIKNLAAFEGVVMYSMQMLPQKPERRRHIYETILAQSCTLHFVLEDTVVSGSADVERIEELLQVMRLAEQAPGVGSLV